MEGMPDGIYDLCRQVTETHSGRIEPAIDALRREVRKMPGFPGDLPDFVETLVDIGISEALYRYRCYENKAAKRQYLNNDTRVASREASDRVAKRVVAGFALRHFVGARMLGDLMGKELPAVRDVSLGQAAGHTFNARLVDNLIPLVPKDSRVREAVTDQQADDLFVRLGGEAIDDLDPSMRVPSANGHAIEQPKPKQSVRGRKTRRRKAAGAK